MNIAIFFQKHERSVNMELKDEDIKKALECCNAFTCTGCPLINEKGCFSKSRENALALINRQQAENEQLQRNLKQCENGYSQELYLARCKIEELKSLCTSEDKLIKELRAEIKQAKSEAIKEFAERLRKEVANTWFGVCCTGETEEYKEGCLFGLVAKQKHCLCIIEKLLAEMAGGENA